MKYNFEIRNLPFVHILPSSNTRTVFWVEHARCTILNNNQLYHNTKVHMVSCVEDNEQFHHTPKYIWFLVRYGL